MSEGRGIDGNFLWGIASAVALAVGSLGPWVSLGPLQVSGAESGADGRITLAIAALAFCVILSRQLRPLVGLLAFGAVAIGAIDTIDVLGDRDGSVFQPSLGWGLIMVDIAALSLLGWTMLGGNSRASDDAAPVSGEGWYERPDEPGTLRWWDGTRWTGATRPAGERVSA